MIIAIWNLDHFKAQINCNEKFFSKPIFLGLLQGLKVAGGNKVVLRGEDIIGILLIIVKSNPYGGKKYSW